MKRMCVCVRNSVLKHGCLQKGIKRYQFSWTDLNGHADHASACFPELTRSATLLLQENNAAAVTHIPCVLLQAAHVCVSRRLHRRFFFFFFWRLPNELPASVHAALHQVTPASTFTGAVACICATTRNWQLVLMNQPRCWRAWCLQQSF